jgi:acetyl-CoA carboxylase biotin carboxyl carrier protein
MSRVPFDPEAIRLLAGILVDTGLTEIEIAEKDSRIRVVRAPAPVQAVAAPALSAPADAAPKASAPADSVDHPGTVRSPMVGIAYLSSEPGVPPFVTPGQSVSVGQTLLLIEAMKTFNQIKAPKAGVVTRVLVASGVPVEYDEPLMIVE